MTYLAAQWLRLLFPLQGTQVAALGGELWRAMWYMPSPPRNAPPKKKKKLTIHDCDYTLGKKRKFWYVLFTTDT